MKTYKFTLTERNGEQEYGYDYLVYAETFETAQAKMNHCAEQWYDDPDVKLVDDHYEFFGGCIFVTIDSGYECTEKEFVDGLLVRYSLK